MSMRDFLQAEAARRAEETAQRAHDARVKELSIHPIVKAGCDRNVREAYFCGLAYAAICNDYRIDDAERDILLTIGNALALDPAFMSDVIKWSVEDDDAKRQAILLCTEVLSTLHNLSSAWMPRLFAAEFARIRLVDPERDFDLAADFKDIGDGCGMPLVDDMARIVSVIKGGASTSLECIDSLAILLGDEVAKYFVLRDMDLVDESLAKFRLLRAFRSVAETKQKMNRQTLSARLSAIVESDDTWPVEFNSTDYKPLFDAAGITDEYVGLFVAKELVPKMKSAYRVAIDQIGSVQLRHEDTGRVWHGVQFDSNKAFRILFRYAALINSFIDLHKISEAYFFVGPGKTDWDYCTGGRNVWFQGNYYSVALDRLSLDDWGSPSGSFVDVYSEQWLELFASIQNAYK